MKLFAYSILMVIYSSIAFSQATGPLRVSRVNPRYLVSTADTNKAIWFGGAHHWGGLQDGKTTYPPDSLYRKKMWDSLSLNNNNITKLWIWKEAGGLQESAGQWYWAPEVFKRTGPGTAADGRLKFNLDSVSTTFLNRLYEYCDSLRLRNIYVVVMLMNGWENSQYYSSAGNPWTLHPFDAANNVNGADADINNNGQGEELHYTPADGGDTVSYNRLIKFCKTVMVKLNPLPNVIFETVLEAATSGNQKYRFIRAVADTSRRFQTTLAYQHPILSGGAWDISNDSLFAITGDIVAPGGNPATTFWDDAPIDMSGTKVVIQDSDHLWGMISDDQTDWVWQNFCKGNSTILQDNFCANPSYPAWDCDNSFWPAFRRAEGQAVRLSLEADLLHMTPSNISSTSTYELAGNLSGRSGQVIVYQASGTVTVDLAGYDSVSVKWYSASLFNTTTGTKTAGGASRNFTAPSAQYDVLWLHEDEPVVVTTRYTNLRR